MIAIAIWLLTLCVALVARAAALTSPGPWYRLPMHRNVAAGSKSRCHKTSVVTRLLPSSSATAKAGMP